MTNKAELTIKLEVLREAASELIMILAVRSSRVDFTRLPAYCKLRRLVTEGE